MQTFDLSGTKREGKGKTAAKAARKAGLVPCVLYGVDENIHFSVAQNDVKGLVYSPNFYKVNLDCEGEKHEAILKDMQFDPVTDRLEHIDFLALKSDRPVIVNIPITFTGLAAGVKEGGKLITKLRTLKVKGLPEQLVDKVEVDVTELTLGKSIKVDVVELDGLEIMTSKSIPMASVDIPRALRSAQSAAEKAGASDAAAGGDAAAEGEEG